MKTQNPSVGTQAASPIENLPTNLELELLYSYDGVEGKTLTNFNCGDANLLLVYFDPYAPELHSGSPCVVCKANGLQWFTMGINNNFATQFEFKQDGIFKQLRQFTVEAYGTTNYVDDTNRMVVRRIYSIKGFKEQGASGSSETSCPYYIGDILQTKNATPPAERWPGTEWAAIDTFLLGASAAHEMGETGGSEKVALTIAQMPRHQHHSLFDKTGNTFTTTEDNTGMPRAIETTGTHPQTGSIVAMGESTGENAPHNNMPPYTAVYIWERTA